MRGVVLPSLLLAIECVNGLSQVVNDSSTQALNASTNPSDSKLPISGKMWFILMIAGISGISVMIIVYLVLNSRPCHRDSFPFARVEHQSYLRLDS